MVKTASTYMYEQPSARRDWIRVYDEFGGPPAYRMAVVLEMGRRDLIDDALSLVSKKGWSLRKQCAVANYFHEIVAGLSYRALVTLALEMVDEHLEQMAERYDRLASEPSWEIYTN